MLYELLTKGDAKTNTWLPAHDTIPTVTNSSFLTVFKKVGNRNTQ